ncbi:MAG: ArsR/SmtB family transcription factor [Puniceicoccaceae bacterium]
MARKHLDRFTEKQVALARFAGAMGHPARIAIVGHLLENGEVCCGGIAARIPLAASTVSQHLRALREAGVVDAREEGVRVCYRLRRDRINSFCDAMQATLGRRAASAG